MIIPVRKYGYYTSFGDNREKEHLFPSRTQKLSFSSPKILGWRRPGKIGHCQDTYENTRKGVFFIYIGVKMCIYAHLVCYSANSVNVLKSART